MGRLGEPEDVADRILRIAEPQGTHLTGQIPAVDGVLELVWSCGKSLERERPGPGMPGPGRSVVQRFVDASCCAV
ncbi:hypothetical protein [Streptomyces wuyuanensis]|uniref:Uncharacterized protein n=1 Tax=Streptomyces wuyuanensis TaxID=1196353 RepID=A0A1H0DZR6_9ACTN|nr:hypothetical protein [Streptomyces wuyuanensis]SDN75513.1 hypothetical protein SAMN05444921_1389 [Streptomyces wuyuanensis]